MADAYPAFDFRRNDNPGSGSGPMGGPGPFAPSNTPVVYPRGTDPIKQFMGRIGVAGMNSEGIPVGSTGGTTFMWSDDVAKVNDMAGAPVMGSQGRMNPFLPGATPQPQQPAAAPTNTFLPGAPTATGDVRFNGLTPATLAPGGTPMLGRDYGAQPAPSTPLSAFGQRLLATGGTETRDGAVFSGAGGKLSITQDPSTVPARGAATGGLNLTPGAMAILTRGVNDFKGEGATGQMLKAIGAGAYDEKPMDSATPEQIAALSLRNQQLRREATNAIPRMMLPNTGNPGVDSQRMNAFLPAATSAIGNVNDMANRAVRNQPEVVTLGGVQYARLGNSMQVIPDQSAPQKQLVAGVTRKLTLPGGATIEAEWDGRDWIDAKSGAQVYITPRDSMGYVTGNPTVNPLITGGAAGQADPLDNVPGGKPAPADKPKLTPAEAKAELERRKASKKQGK